MERKRLIYRSTGRNTLDKALFILGFIGLPILFGLSAYFWLFKKNDKAGKKKIRTAVSQRVKKGIPPGLINLGNTCFINCLLQAFSSVKHFCKWIEDLDDDKDKILLSSLKDMLQVLNNKKYADQDLFSASDVIESLSAHGWIGTTQQQDVHEFFQVLSSTLEDELAAITCNEFSPVSEEAYSTKLKGVVNRACREISAKPSFPVSPFKGALANRMICLSCGYQSVRFDPFETISLRIPRFSSLTVSSLDSCLAEFTKRELVDDVNCPCCTKLRGSFMPVKSRFSKQLTFAKRFPLVAHPTKTSEDLKVDGQGKVCIQLDNKLPKCFCFHIQRSHFISNGSPYKNNQFIRFSEILDIAPCRYDTMVGNRTSKGRLLIDNHGDGEEVSPLRGGSSNFSINKNTSKVIFSSSLYRLQSVIVHIGEVHKGHFITYRRATKSDDWVFSSDECTKFVSRQSVLSSNAYLLFYERADEQIS